MVKRFIKVTIQILIYFSGFTASAMLLAATAYKCVDETGTTIFSDAPCKGTQSEQIYIHDSFTEGETLRSDELKMLQEIKEKEKQQQQEANPSLPEPETRPEPVVSKPVVDKKECKKATEDLKQWQKVMSLGYPPEESEYYLQEYKNKFEYQKKSCGLTE